MRGTLCLLLLLTCVIQAFCASCSTSNKVSIRSGNIKSCTGREQRKRYRSCGFLWLSRCASYYYSSYTYYVCNDGYDGSSCEYPVCNDLYGSSACQPDGNCSSPGYCTCNNTMYYADGPQCRLCPQKEHCIGNTTCSTRFDAKCQECESNNEHYDAYKLDDGDCLKKCSWVNKRQCYPGFCEDDLLSNCVCAEGFTGKEPGDCRTISAAVDRVDPVMKLWDSNDNKSGSLWVYVNGKNQSSAPVNWTNRVQLDRASFSVFLQKPCGEGRLPNGTTIPLPPMYIIANDSKCGVLTASVHIQLRKASGASYDYYHNALSTNDPRPTVNFVHNFHLSRLTNHANLGHLDSMLVYLTATNGGYMKYFNFDVDPPEEEQYQLNGHTSTTYSWLKFDMVEPTHVCETQDDCQANPLEVPDVTTEAENNISWEGWTDSPAGIKEWHLTVYTMKSVNHQLHTKEKIYTDIITTTGQEYAKKTVSMELKDVEPGMYSVYLTTIDEAGNSIVARRLMLYDDNPRVTKHGRTPSVSGAKKTEDGFLWITTPMHGLYVKWLHRFRNVKLYRNHWLERVVPMTTKKKFLDDHEGMRQLTPVKNAWGIVKFEVAFTTIQHGVITRHPFSVVPNIKQGSVIKEVLMDEKHLSIQVRAFDIFGEFAEDVVKVTVDFSPPEIRAVWLSTDGSNLEEYIDELSISWEVFDDVSGLLHLTWEIVAGATKKVLTRKHIEVSPKNGTEECIPAHSYTTHSHRPPCYCTEFHGCFNTVFRVQPDINVKLDLRRTLKDHDFFIKIKATNKAMLSSEHTHSLF